MEMAEYVLCIVFIRIINYSSIFPYYYRFYQYQHVSKLKTYVIVIYVTETSDT